MNLDRLAGVADFDRVTAAKLCIVGCGASADLAVQLARSGVRKFVLVDPDVVEPENLCRQGFYKSDLGIPKVDAVRSRLEMLDDSIDICTLQQPFDASDVQDVNLYLSLTDSTAASLVVNDAAIVNQTPAIWAGVYDRGLAGEVAFWKPGLNCYECLFPHRHAESRRPSSTAVSIFDTSYVDAIVGQLALGLLSGPDSRFGRMVDALGTRHFIRIKIDPHFAFHGRDMVREHLGIASDNTSYFGWCTTAESDPLSNAGCKCSGGTRAPLTRSLSFRPL